LVAAVCAEPDAARAKAKATAGKSFILYRAEE
jgi:hypothetical protein